MAANCPLMAFLCLAGALLTAGAAVKYYPECPEGWTLFGTRCFKFFFSQSTWTESEKSCQSLGANLASIHSAEENAFVVELIRGADVEGVVNEFTWIGGQDAVKEKVWMWSDGSVWDYAIWGRGQPDNWRGKDHFTVIYSKEAVWRDYFESWTINYICAKDAAGNVDMCPEIFCPNVCPDICHSAPQ
uniref:C-type lectin domain-containing protein n=1 Tax=Neogobius melanostomus TaxID=47308 RepID=A0A8C6UFQ1_9GOBI